MKFSDENKLFALKLTRVQVLYIFLNFYQRKHQRQQFNNNIHVKLFYFYILINVDMIMSEEFSKRLPKSKAKLRTLEQLKNCKLKKKTPLLPEMFDGLDNFEFSLKSYCFCCCCCCFFVSKRVLTCDQLCGREIIKCDHSNESY